MQCEPYRPRSFPCQIFADTGQSIPELRTYNSLYSGITGMAVWGHPRYTLQQTNIINNILFF